MKNQKALPTKKWMHRSVIPVLAGFAGVAAVSVGFWWYMQPMQAAKELGYAAVGHDYPAITKAIDYDALKVNMAKNLHRIIAQNNIAHHMHLPPRLISEAADNGAANIASPRRVQGLLEHVLPNLGTSFHIVRYTGQFLSLSRYSVLVTAASGGHIRAIFYRQPGSFSDWKLGDIEIFPPNMPLNAYPRPATQNEVAKLAPTIQIRRGSPGQPSVSFGASESGTAPARSAP